MCDIARKVSLSHGHFIASAGMTGVSSKVIFEWGENASQTSRLQSEYFVYLCSGYWLLTLRYMDFTRDSDAQSLFVPTTTSRQPLAYPNVHLNNAHRHIDQ